jgi:hypothetical protein
MSSLAKRIKRAGTEEAINDCLRELAALLALADQRIKELVAEELDRRIDDAMWPGLKDLG